MKKLEKSILAEGEVTGHAHVLGGEVDVYELESGLRTFFNSEKVEIKHEEHGIIEIPAGEYISGVVKEYDHFKEELRNVKD